MQATLQWMVAAVYENCVNRVADAAFLRFNLESLAILSSSLLRPSPARGSNCGASRRPGSRDRSLFSPAVLRGISCTLTRTVKDQAKTGDNHSGGSPC